MFLPLYIKIGQWYEPTIVGYNGIVLLLIYDYRKTSYITTYLIYVPCYDTIKHILYL